MSANSLLHPSLVPLEGGINFRDLGGNVMADGRRIKRGLLYRSGSLDGLTAKDSDLLSRIPVSHVLDYRDEEEAAAQPDILWSHCAYHHVPANPPGDEANANLAELTVETLTEFDPQEFMLELYRRLPFNNEAYKALVNLLRQPGSGAIVQHCAVGKDRTGIGSALVLLALGADLPTVKEDYLLTDKTLAPFREELLDAVSTNMPPSAVKKFEYVLSVKELFLDTALDAIVDLYGTTDHWLEKEYGLTNEVREELRSRYLE